jgi:hypothetical protein
LLLKKLTLPLLFKAKSLSFGVKPLIKIRIETYIASCNLKKVMGSVDDNKTKEQQDKL